MENGDKSKTLDSTFSQDIFSPKIFTPTDPQGSTGPAEEPLVLFSSIGRNEKFWDRWVSGTALFRPGRCLVTFILQQRPLEAIRKKPCFCSALARRNFYRGY